MFSWSSSTNLKIIGAEGHSPESLRSEIARGATFVIYSYNFSLLIVSFKRPSSIYFIPAGASRVVKGLPFTLASLVFGWWGIPWGIIYTIQTLWQNLGGGKDVTDLVFAAIVPPPLATAADGSPPPAVPPPLLPPRPPSPPFNPRPYFLAGGILAAVVALVYIGNCYNQGRHLPVALVSGLTTAYDVTLNGQRHHLRPGAPEVFELPEGEFTVETEFPGGLREKQQFTFTTDFLSRPFTDRIAVLNPDGAAVIYEETTFYKPNTSTEKPPDNTYVLHAAETNYFLPKPEIVFAAFPLLITMPRGSSSVAKTRLGLLEKTTPTQAAAFVGEKLGHPVAVRYLTALARINPDDELVLRAVVQTLKPEEGLTFFQSRLAQRPVLLEWHRFYQQFAEYFAPQVTLAEQYRGYVAAEPANGDLLYLLARLENDRTVSHPLYERALAAQPPCSYAYGALGFDELSSGRFERALELFGEAESHGLHSDSIVHNKRAALLGLHRFDPVIQEVQRRRTASPDELELVADEILLTLAAGRDASVAATLKSTYLARLKSQKVVAAQSDAADHYLASVIAIGQGRTADYIRQLEMIPGQAKSYEVALARGDLPGAEKVLRTFPRVNSQAWLLLYLGAQRAGDRSAAEIYFGRAASALATESAAHKQLAASLAGGPPLSPEAACDLVMMPEEKRVVLAALGLRQPANREIYFQHARLMNVEPGFAKSYLDSILSP